MGRKKEYFDAIERKDQIFPSKEKKSAKKLTRWNLKGEVKGKNGA